jgi:hypothetical protein
MFDSIQPFKASGAEKNVQLCSEPPELKFHFALWWTVCPGRMRECQPKFLMRNSFKLPTRYSYLKLRVTHSWLAMQGTESTYQESVIHLLAIS